MLLMIRAKITNPGKVDVWGMKNAAGWEADEEPQGQQERDGKGNRNGVRKGD